jgi:hypothetical protein
MPYGSLLADVVQSSTSGVAPVFKDGNGTQVGTLCRAWVYFNGSTGVIAASFNVSSVTVTTTGQWVVNFTTALPDGNYSVSGSTIGATESCFLNSNASATKSTTQCAVAALNYTGTYRASTAVNVMIFR